MIEPNPIERFLSLPGVGDSPFELLGLTPERCGPRAVQVALARRLQMVARHPEAMSHEADEVRLALHAAEAQLLDPLLRERLLARSRSAGAAVTGDATDHIAFRELARRALAQSGGWSPTSRRWLSTLAHAHGLTKTQLQSELRAIAASATWPQAPSRRRAGAAPSSQDEARRERQTIHAQIHTPRRRRPQTLSASAVYLIGAIASLVVIAGVALLFEAAGGAQRQAPSATAAENASGGAPDAMSTASATVAKQESASKGASGAAVQLRSPEVIVRWLELANDNLANDPGQAAWRFERAVRALATTWMQFSVASQSQANELVVAFVHRSGARSASGVRAVSAVTSGVGPLLDPHAEINAGVVRAALWSAAMSGALAADPDADRSVRRSAASAWSRLMGQASVGGASRPSSSFDASARSALPGVAAAIIARLAERPSSPQRDAWSAWLQAVERITRHDGDSARGAASDRLILQAVERLLRSGARVSTNAAARDALTLLLGQVRWTAGPSGEPARAQRSLIAWFDEPGVATPDLAVVTEWLVAKAGAGALGPQMTLSRAGSLERRSALRDRYARHWGVNTRAETIGFATVWAQTARDTLKRFTGRSPASRLALVTVMSRLSESAALRWRGESDAARAILVDPISPINAAMRETVFPMGKVRDPRANANRDGKWTVRYLSSNARDVETRSRLLVEISRNRRALGPVDADVVVSVALRSPAAELRSRAQQVVRRRAAEPGVVSALLDAITHAPKNTSTTALIADVVGQALPPPTDDAWPIRIRLALVNRLLVMLAPSDEQASIDRLAGLLARSYASRAGGTEPTSIGEAFGEESAQTDGGPSPEPADPLGLLWSRWRDEAEPLAPNRRAPISLEQIVRRRSARSQLADGQVQRFAAEQVSVAEAMAMVISAQRPSRAGDVHEVIGRMSTDRQTASNIFGQMIAAERAMLELWAIRFGLDPGEVVPAAFGPVATAMFAPAPQSSAQVSDDAMTGETPVPRMPWLDSAPIEHLRQRLAALSPDQPLAYFKLAEEVASESPDVKGRALARRLYVLAFEYDRRSDAPVGLGASVCLALADITSRKNDRRWLLALAASLDPSIIVARSTPGLGATGINDDGRDARPADRQTRLKLAEALELYRLGYYREAQDRLDDPAVGALFDSLGDLLTGGAGAVREELATEPVCHECKNRRIVPADLDPNHAYRLCYTCGGDPGPDLTDNQLIEQLRLEQALLSDKPRSWSVSLATTHAQPLRDVDPDALAPWAGVKIPRR